MSFLKINNPEKRDFIVQEYLNTNDNIRKNYITERTGELSAQRKLTKFFRPVIEAQKTAAKNLSKKVTQPITSALLPITEGVRKAVEFAKYPFIKTEVEEGDVSDISILYLGNKATRYFRQFVSKEGVDKTFGLYDKDDAFYVGDSPVKIMDDSITIKGKKYEGTHLLTDEGTSKTRNAACRTLHHGLGGSNKLLYKRCARSMGRPKFRPPQLPHFSTDLNET